MTPLGKLIVVMRRGPVLPAPYRVAWRHKPTFFGKLAMERWVAAGSSLPSDLKSIAGMRAGAMVGCVW
ncbi:MAG: hypothetical protein R2754_02600 [Microthrixaceae bacterium]